MVRIALPKTQTESILDWANNETADSVVIHWPSGTIQTLLNVPSDQIIRVVESEGTTDLSPQQPAPTQPDILPETGGSASNDGGGSSGGCGGAFSIYALILC